MTTQHTVAPTSGELDRHIAKVGSGLVNAIRGVLDGLPEAPLRPTELTRKLGISQPVSSRLCKATATKDPIAATYLMPGPESLRRLCNGASRHKVDPRLIQDAEAAIEQFERLIHEVAGDRSSLDTIIGAWLPDVREKAELLSRQAVFRGMSQILGYWEDVALSLQFVHPAASGANYDWVTIYGSLGLRRLRPGAEIVQNHFDLRAASEQGPFTTLGGSSITTQQDATLPQFCSAPTPEFEVRKYGEQGGMHFVLQGNQVGLQSAVDVVWASAIRSTRIRGTFLVLVTPAKKIVFDLFLHRDIAKRADPSLTIYNTAGRGPAHVDDPTRLTDRIDPMSSIDCLGSDASRIRCSDVAHYPEMIQHVCGKMAWDPAEFQCYRCLIEYPVYGSQVCIGFDSSSQ